MKREEKIDALAKAMILSCSRSKVQPNECLDVIAGSVSQLIQGIGVAAGEDPLPFLKRFLTAMVAGVDRRIKKEQE